MLDPSRFPFDLHVCRRLFVVWSSHCQYQLSHARKLSAESFYHSLSPNLPCLFKLPRAFSRPIIPDVDSVDLAQAPSSTPYHSVRAPLLKGNRSVKMKPKTEKIGHYRLRPRKSNHSSTISYSLGLFLPRAVSRRGHHSLPSVDTHSDIRWCGNMDGIWNGYGWLIKHASPY